MKVTEEIDVNKYTPLCLADTDYDVRGNNVTLTGVNPLSKTKRTLFFSRLGFT